MILIGRASESNRAAYNSSGQTNRHALKPFIMALEMFTLDRLDVLPCTWEIDQNGGPIISFGQFAIARFMAHFEASAFILEFGLLTDFGIYKLTRLEAIQFTKATVCLGDYSDTLSLMSVYNFIAVSLSISFSTVMDVDMNA